MSIADLQSTKTMASERKGRMFLGQDLSWWNNAMLLSLGLAAVAAIAVVITTRVVIILQDQEAADKAAEFAAYRVEADERIAATNERAAEASLKAEQERVERLKLEARYAPRVITDEQVTTLATALAPLAGQSVDVISYETLGTDVAEYAFLLTANLNHAGLRATQFTPFSGSGLVRGVVVQSEAGSSREQASILAEALKEAGIAAQLMDPYPAGQVIAGGYMGPTGVAPTAKLRLLVGAKPQPNPVNTAQ